MQPKPSSSPAKTPTHFTNCTENLTDCSVVNLSVSVIQVCVLGYVSAYTGHTMLGLLQSMASSCKHHENPSGLQRPRAALGGDRLGKG